MSIDTLTPEFQEVLLHDILPGKARLLPANQDLVFGSPDHAHIAAQPNGRIVDLTRITPPKDMELIRVDAHSKWMQALSEDPLEQHKAMYTQLHEGLELTPPADFWVISVYPKTATEMIAGNPQEILVSLSTDNFREISMKMLKKMADPHVGSQFAHGGDVKHYEADLADPNSETSNLIKHIITNARLSVDELDELRNSAARKSNFEFCKRLMEIGDAIHPGFAAARSRKKSGLGEGGRSSLPGM